MQDQHGIVWRSEERPCPVCNVRDFIVVGVRGGRAHRDGKGLEARVVRCRKCQTYFCYPTLLPTSNPYLSFSSDEYFVHHDSEKKVRWGEALAAQAEAIVGGPGKMLELGCGRGELLRGAQNRGWDVYGVEMSEQFVQVAAAAGITVEHAAANESTLLRSQTYDFIALPAILEHLYDPVETLRLVHAGLRPGGAVFIDIPNEGSLAVRMGNLYMRLRRRDWCVNLSPTFEPFHVVGFTPRPFRRLMERLGFRIHSLEVPQWGNVTPARGLVQQLERRAFGLFQYVGRRLGMGDGIVCWATKV